jgi:hypothetical protein
MKTLVTGTVAGFMVVTLGFFSAGRAAIPCPAQVTEAKVALASASKSELDIQAFTLHEAGGLVGEAEAACQQGDMTLASRKAQEALGLLKSVPATGQPGVGDKIPPSATAPGRGRPSDSDYYQPSPNVAHDPAFIGPTGKTETGAFGFSAWIAPTTPVGNELAGGWRRQSGVPAIGFTFTWGGPSRRPEPLQAP